MWGLNNKWELDKTKQGVSLDEVNKKGVTNLTCKLTEEHKKVFDQVVLKYLIAEYKRCMDVPEISNVHAKRTKKEQTERMEKLARREQFANDELERKLNEIGIKDKSTIHNLTLEVKKEVGNSSSQDVVDYLISPFLEYLKSRKRVKDSEFLESVQEKVKQTLKDWGFTNQQASVMASTIATVAHSEHNNPHARIKNNRGGALQLFNLILEKNEQARKIVESKANEIFRIDIPEHDVTTEIPVGKAYTVLRAVGRDAYMEKNYTVLDKCKLLEFDIDQTVQCFLEQLCTSQEPLRQESVITKFNQRQPAQLQYAITHLQEAVKRAEEAVKSRNTRAYLQSRNVGAGSSLVVGGVATSVAIIGGATVISGGIVAAVIGIGAAGVVANGFYKLAVKNQDFATLRSLSYIAEDMKNSWDEVNPVLQELVDVLGHAQLLHALGYIKEQIERIFPDVGSDLERQMKNYFAYCVGGEMVKQAIRHAKQISEDEFDGYTIDILYKRLDQAAYNMFTEMREQTKKIPISIWIEGLTQENIDQIFSRGESVLIKQRQIAKFSMNHDEGQTEKMEGFVQMEEEIDKRLAESLNRLDKKYRKQIYSQGLDDLMKLAQRRVDASSALNTTKTLEPDAVSEHPLSSGSGVPNLLALDVASMLRENINKDRVSGPKGMNRKNET